MSIVMVPSLLLTKPHVICVPPGQRTQGSGLNPGSLMSIIPVRCCVKGGPTFLSQAPYTPLTPPVCGTLGLSSALSPTVWRLPGGKGDKWYLYIFPYFQVRHFFWRTRSSGGRGRGKETILWPPWETLFFSDFCERFALWGIRPPDNKWSISFPICCILA